MKKNIFLVLLTVSLLIVFIMPSLTWADVAPPEEPFGGDVAPGDSTMVQMVSEVVMIKVLEEEKEREDFSFSRPVADVEATFVMLNRGDEDESLEVHFPLNLFMWNYADWPVPEVTDFEAFVDGEEVSWERVLLAHPTDESSDPIAWAVFEVDFPVDQMVGLVVKYQMPAMGYSPRATFSYIFQTGGGWYDVIEQADLIVSLPYQASDLTVAYQDTLPEGAEFDAHQIRWRFEDLEPTEEDNLTLTIMAPKMVNAIEEAQRAILDDPSFENLEVLSELLFEVCSLKGMFANEAWAGYLSIYEETLALMHFLQPDNLEVKARYAVALTFHDELHSYDVLTDVPIPTDLAFVDDVMFELKNLEQADMNDEELMVFSILDLFYYFNYGDDYDAYFDGFVPQGIEMPMPSDDAVFKITGLEE